MEIDTSIDELCAYFLNRRRNMEGIQRRSEGSQFRRANIVYFLSRNGAVEQPHLLRVHHLHNKGVHLRDVKRWLAEIRGKDMPDSFAWSYKRRYKSGYVWQDLKDDDLITAISDNEYVLKGSFLQFQSLSTDPNKYLYKYCSEEIDEILKTPKKTPETAQPEPEPEPKLESKPEPDTLQIKLDDEELSRPPPELDHDSPVKPHKHLDDPNRRMVMFKMDGSAKKQEEEQKFRRSYSSRASHVFRNILACGVVDTNDAVLMPMSRDENGGSHRRKSTSDIPHQHNSESDNFRKSRRSGGGKSTANYKPMGAPNCSQCGRPFDPKKLHLHMQSCKALRGLQKGRISIEKMPLRRESCEAASEDFSSESISGYLT